MKVVICTDIASDIDDAWALAFAMKCPELEIDCVLVSHGPTPARARVAAKLLSIGGCDDVPVLVGKAKSTEENAQRRWARDFVPKHPVVADGPRALARRLMRSDGPVTLITLGPLTDVARMLELQPQVKEHINEIIIMGGSIYRGHGGSPPCAEYNILSNVKAAQTVFSSGLPIVLVPLDATRMMQPSEECMRLVRENKQPIPRAMYELFEAWGHPVATLFDPVAVAVAFRSDFVKTERMCIEVTDDGYTRVVPDATPNAVVCLDSDKARFMELFMERVLQ